MKVRSVTVDPLNCVNIVSVVYLAVLSGLELTVILVYAAATYANFCHLALCVE
ncbi:hypothetical protein LEMLEM_LOCUS15381 [Lemmus lemmus]